MEFCLYEKRKNNSQFFRLQSFISLGNIMADVKMSSIYKSFGNTEVIHGVDLGIKRGTLFLY